MHIFGGKYQRRSLNYPKDRSFRPTNQLFENRYLIL